MKTKKRKLFSKKEGFFIFFLTFFIFISFFFFKSNFSQKKIAVIEINENILKKIDLSSVTEPYEIKIDTPYPTTILVEHEKISVSHASCPDKTCHNMGKISNSGEVIVCLPNKLIIKIENKKYDSDGVTY